MRALRAEAVRNVCSMVVLVRESWERITVRA